MATLAELFADPRFSWMNSSIGPQYHRNDSRFAEWDRLARMSDAELAAMGNPEGGIGAPTRPWRYDDQGNAYLERSVSTPDGVQAGQRFDPFTGMPLSGVTKTAYANGSDLSGGTVRVPWEDKLPGLSSSGSDFMDGGLALMLAAAGGLAGAGYAGYGAAADAIPGVAQSVGTSAATNAVTGGGAAAGGANAASDFSFYDNPYPVNDGTVFPQPNYSIPGVGDVYGKVGGIGTGLTLKSLIDAASKNGGGISSSDLMRGLPSLIGAIGANEQAQAQKELADKFMGFGAPSRERYEASFKPGFTMSSDPGYQDALDQATRAFTNRNSVGSGMGGVGTSGPNAWAQTLEDINSKFAYPALQNYRNQNASTGGFGAFNTAAPQAAAGAAGAEGNVWNALGYGANQVFNPPKSLAEQLRELQGTGIFK